MLMPMFVVVMMMMMMLLLFALVVMAVNIGLIFCCCVDAADHVNEEMNVEEGERSGQFWLV
jgi:hypothetical protein